jgi:large repetitive protein
MRLKTLILGLLTILGLCTALLAQRTLNPQTSNASSTHSVTISATLPPATTGVSYNATFIASGGTPPYRFTVSSGQLPTGLVLAKTTGVLSGTPNQTGTFSFTVSASDLHSHSGTHTFQITVAKAHSVVVTVSPTTATLTSAATQQFSALVSNASNVAVTWSATSGSISNTGLYQAPTVNSNTTATVTATSAADPTKSGTASVTITPPPLGFTTTSLIGATAGTAYSTVLTASGGTAPYTLALTSGTLPLGIALQSTGSLGGTTSQTGQFTFTVQVSDSSSPKLTASKSFTLSVAPPPLSLATTSLSGATSGVAYSNPLTASGGTAPFSWSLTSGNLPAGITLQSAGSLSGTTTQAGQFTLPCRSRIPLRRNSRRPALSHSP